MISLFSALSFYIPVPLRGHWRKSAARAGGGRTRQRTRLCLERLEDRALLSGGLSISDASAAEGISPLTFMDHFVTPGSGGLSRSEGSIFGPDGNLYVSSGGLNAILRYDGVTGAFKDTFVPSGSGGLQTPYGLAFGPDGNLYVASWGTNQVLRYDGSSGTFLGTVVSGLSLPIGLTFGPDGSLYIGNRGSNEVLRYNNSGLSAFVTAGTGGLSQPRKAVFGPDGNMYVASEGTKQVLRYNGLTGAFMDAFTTMPPIEAGTGPMWLEFGSDGYLYTAARDSSTSLNMSIVRFNAANGTFVDRIALGRDGWSFDLGPGNVVYDSADGSGGFVDRYGSSPPPSSIETFTVSLDSPSTSAITVNYATADGTALAGRDYLATSGTLTFPPGVTTQTIQIPTVDDGVVSPTRTFTVTLSNAVGASITRGQGIGTIFDSAAPVITTTVFPNGAVNQPGYRQTIGASGGSGSLTFSATGTIPPGLLLSPGGVLSGTPTVAGTFSFVISVSDAVDASSFQSFAISIIGVPPPLQVVPGSLVGTPSGFSLQFNAPLLINSVTPVLFGQGFAATAPAPSVTLTGPDGPVEGSLVVNTATNSLTFVETNTASLVNNDTPILPDGTYTVDVLSSGPTGIQAQGGGYLDGLGTGNAGSGDFTTTFTVHAAAAGDDAVWVPPTADGPGQALNAPGNNQTGGGYPVYLDDNTGAVVNVQVTLNYDPTLLNVSGVTGANFSPLGSSTPGHAVLQYSGPALPAGMQTPIGFIIATVPSGTAANPMPYRAKDLLHLSGVSLNGGAIPVTSSDALHVVAYVGDADGNGSYSGNDAALITRATLQTDTGFAAYPLIDPVIVADIDGAGFIPADAPLQANEAAIGFPTANLPNPPIPSGVVFQPVANNVDPTLSLAVAARSPAVVALQPWHGQETVPQQGGETVPQQGGNVTVAVNIDDAHPDGSTGLIRANLALTYDPRQFTVSAADVHLGSVLLGGTDWALVPTIDQASGEIAIALSSTTPIASDSGGSLVTIDFHQRASVGQIGNLSYGGGRIGNPSYGDSAAFQLVATASPNGQVVMTELEDAQGTFTLTPAPTNGFDPRIDGVVTLTAAPAEAGVGQPVAATESLTAMTPVEAPTTAPGMVEIAVRETTVRAPVAASEDNEPSVIRGTAETMTLHGSALQSAAVVGATGSPITGLVYPIANRPVVALVSPGQPLADPLFQSLVRGPNASDPTLAFTIKEAFERVLAGQQMVLPANADSIDNLSWDDVGSDRADWKSIPRSWGDLDQAAVDAVFGQTSDAAEQTMDDE